MGMAQAQAQEGHGRLDERGFTLVEVVVAGLLLVLVLVPSAMVLSTSTKVLSLNQDKVVAANLLSGTLEEDRTIATVSGQGSITGWSGSPTIAPPLPTLPTVVVNGVAFTFNRQTGWCAPAQVNGMTKWANYPLSGTYQVEGMSVDEPPAFAEYLTVSWRGGADSLSAGQVLTTPAANDDIHGANPPATSGSCPL